MQWNNRDWALLQHDTHQGLQQLVSDLNRSYRDMPALHRHDFDEQGFRWIDCNDASQSIIAFIRQEADQHLVCVLIFTPVVRENSRIGLPDAGRYKEVINTDAGIYGGSNCGNAGLIETEDQPWSDFPCSAELTLPPLGGLLLTWNKD